MKISISLFVISFVAAATARSVRHVGNPGIPDSKLQQRNSKASHGMTTRSSLPKAAFDNAHLEKRYTRPGKTVISQNSNTTKFAVDGTGLPEVNFDIGESYAGLLPISADPNESRQLYFWFFPSENPLAKDEITVWLNGGPGKSTPEGLRQNDKESDICCSSLEGLFQENGPVIWQYGTYRPVKNPWTWVNLTSVVWVEQPVGTGFSQGKPSATNEEEAADQFLGFFKTFIDTFGLHNKKIYVTGESYAGYYVPYIADAMFNREDKAYYDVDSIMIYDPSTSYDVVQQDIPALPYAEHFTDLFHLNDTFLADIRQRDEACGYAAFREKYLTFPPPAGGHYPMPPNGSADGCSIWSEIIDAVTLFNPCFDVYATATTCPILWDNLGFPGSFEYLPAGTDVYFNRTDVQQAINAPIQEWNECSDGVLEDDTSLPSGLSVLPKVIERASRTVIGHGSLDFILLYNGTLLMIQNMTWNGQQGFQEAPSTPFFVPYHSGTSAETLAGSGVFGTTHTERGLTWVETWLSGHMVPQYAPSAAFRQLEFLLGRIPSLDTQSDFTTETGDFRN